MPTVKKSSHIRFPKTWFQNRIYAPSAVDAVLEDSAISVDRHSVDMLAAPPPAWKVEQLDGLKTERLLLGLLAEKLYVNRDSVIGQLEQVSEFTKDIENLFPSVSYPASKGYYETPQDFWWGGTEEIVIAKGSDWCHEVARVYCALCQVLEIPCRLVYTASETDGHVIAEAYWRNSWTLVDPLAAKVYRKPDGSPLSVLDLKFASPEQLSAITASREGYYVNPVFFEHLFVAEYWLADSEKYDYSLSPCNAYYARLLKPIWNQ